MILHVQLFSFMISFSRLSSSMFLSVCLSFYGHQGSHLRTLTVYHFIPIQFPWNSMHQRNRWIHDRNGFAGSFDAPWSRQIRIRITPKERSQSRKECCSDVSSRFFGVVALHELNASLSQARVTSQARVNHESNHFFSGAPAARRAAKRSPILIMGKKRKPMSNTAVKRRACANEYISWQPRANFPRKNLKKT